MITKKKEIRVHAQINGYSVNRNASRSLSPYRNTDLKEAEKNGDWSALIEKAQKSTIRFRNEFYKKSA
jgi:hypothetical protein